MTSLFFGKSWTTDLFFPRKTYIVTFKFNKAKKNVPIFDVWTSIFSFILHSGNCLNCPILPSIQITLWPHWNISFSPLFLNIHFNIQFSCINFYMFLVGCFQYSSEINFVHIMLASSNPKPHIPTKHGLSSFANLLQFMHQRSPFYSPICSDIHYMGNIQWLSSIMWLSRLLFDCSSSSVLLWNGPIIKYLLSSFAAIFSQHSLW